VRYYKSEIIKFITGVALSKAQALKMADVVEEPVLVVSFNGAISLYVTDPLGRNMGINPATGDLENQVPGGQVNMDSGAGALTLKNPENGIYTVSVKGNKVRDYRLEIGFMGTAATPLTVLAGFNHGDTTSFTFAFNADDENKIEINYSPPIP